MNHPEPYTDFRGNVIPLCELDAEELTLVKQLREFAAAKPEWTDYQNYYMPAVASFYTPRGLSRREITQTTPWRIAQDLGASIGLAEGRMRPGDYRDELNMLVHTKFKSRRAFCEATGLSEDMLSHVLAGRKNLSIDALTEALGRIGYGVHIAPLPAAALPGAPLANLGPDSPAAVQ
jgi:hypothetical protein